MDDQSRSIDVFFYGLYMDDDLLRQKGLNPKNRRLATLDNFWLVIGERATLLPMAGRSVHGVLCSLTHGELDVLYAEPSVSMYRPEAVLARATDGSLVPALCFNLPTTLSAGERNSEYASRLKELGRRIGLPPEYLSAIQ